MRDPPGILLLGHGSHVDGLSSDPVHRVARRLREQGTYPEVRVAFWKEEPQLRHAFLLVESPRVVAVPLFTSEGYFTDRVLPRELRIEPPVSVADRIAVPDPGTGGVPGAVSDTGGMPGAGTADRPGAPAGSADEGESQGEADAAVPAVGPDAVQVYYTRPVGTHPAMAEAVLERARDLLDEEGLLSDHGSPPGDVTLVVLGHGTERHPASGEVVERVTRHLARISAFRRVTCAFLDQEPRMLPVLEAVETSMAVVVPFFIAEGWHVGQTIPRDLGLDRGRGRVGAPDGAGVTEVLYAPPVGTHPAVAEVVEQMVAEAVSPSGPAPSALPGHDVPTRDRPNHDRPAHDVPTPLPVRARRAFLHWIREGGPEGRRFLQTQVRRMELDSEIEAGHGTLYEIRHADDAEVDRDGLRRASDPEAARALAARTAAGEHRPLKTAPDLPGGWLLEGLTGREVWEVYAHLYPVAPVHWYLGRTGELPVISFRETAARQTGMYEVVARLDDAAVEETRESLCAPGCLRRVRWPIDGAAVEVPPDDAPAGSVPCPEPCSLFVTRARERAPDRSESEERRGP